MKTRSWTGQTAAFLTVALATLALTAHPVWAASEEHGANTTLVRTTVEFEDLLVPNYCTGELISESGSVTVLTRITTTGQGGFFYNMHYWFEATGTGDLGNEYIIRQQARQRIFLLPSEGRISEISNRFVQISQGTGENSHLVVTLRTIVDGQGNITLQIVDAYLDCNG